MSQEQQEDYSVELEADLDSSADNRIEAISFPEFGRTDSIEKNGFFCAVLEGLDVVVSAMIAVILIFIFVFKVPTIDGNSMNDTLINGERIIISNAFYQPKYGDIVVLSRNYSNNEDNVERYSMPIIKRVIATEGQTVDIDFEKGIVYVDGVALEENYTKTPTNLSYDVSFPVTVPQNCIFVMGDNRNDSLDSRSSQIGNGGMVDKRYVLGRAILRVFPFNKLGKID